MSGKAFFIDTTRCTACRGCQVACKQWNQLPATRTIQWGSHQNPKNLSPFTWKLVRFSETMGSDGKPRWYFFPDQCRHCIDPPCSYIPDNPGAVMVDKMTGAVIHTVKLSEYEYADVRASCPYDIPRATAGNNIFGKCTMCLDRVKKGLLPACVKACSTGAMNFGNYDEMGALAKKRLADRQKKNMNAQLAGLGELRVIYLFDTEPMEYWDFAVA